jgi:hypothetical protein
MFLNIRQRALPVLTELFSEQTADITRIAAHLTSPKAAVDAFNELDQDGNRKLSVEEILEYDGKFSDVLAPILRTLKAEMALGEAGEDLDAIPELTLARMISLGRGGRPSPVNLKVQGFGSATPSDVSLAAFGDGSVKSLGSNSSSSWYFFLTRGQKVHGGLFFATDPRSSSLSGLVLGVLKDVRTPAFTGEQFEGVLIGTEGTGTLSGATGAGRVSLNFTHDVGGPFNGHVKVFSGQGN